MPVQLTKELILAEDIDFGDGPSLQVRGGNKLNGSHIPYSDTQSLNDAMSIRPTAVEVGVSYAPILGNASNLFKVANGISGNDAVTFQQMDTKEDRTEVALKAYKADVLELNNQTPYQPVNDYHPATKKFVDDSIFNAFKRGISGSFGDNNGKTVTVTNGLITGII